MIRLAKICLLAIVVSGANGNRLFFYLGGDRLREFYTDHFVVTLSRAMKETRPPLSMIHVTTGPTCSTSNTM